MVGHSLGGPYALTFTARYPREVVGLALVDASHPDQVARFAAAGAAPPAPMRALMWAAPRAGPALARVGVLRLLPDFALRGWTAAERDAFVALAPPSLAAMLVEGRALDASLASAGRATTLGERPLVVLTAMRPAPGGEPEASARHLAAWRALHEEEARWSTRGRHVLVADASHYIHVDRPDLVVAEVRRLVAETLALAGGTP
jgi:pimeloyl-ACP methyl ester carboxylesterase